MILKNLILSILNVKKMFLGPHRHKQNTEMLLFDEMMATIITKTFSISTSKRYKATPAFVWVLGSSFGLHRLLLRPRFFVDERQPIHYVNRRRAFSLNTCFFTSNDDHLRKKGDIFEINNTSSLKIQSVHL